MKKQTYFLSLLFVIAFFPHIGMATSADRPVVLVVSDIDDTLKESYVLNKIEMVKRFRYTGPEIAFPGMAHLYQVLMRDLSEKGYDVRFAYVSNAYQTVMGHFHHEFLRRSRFPVGYFVLRPVFEKESGFKVKAIRQLILENHPAAVMMIGDHGQQDSQVYAQITKDLSSTQVPSSVYIRQVYGPQTSATPIPSSQYAFVATAELAMAFADADLITPNSFLTELIQYQTPGARYVECPGHRLQPGPMAQAYPQLIQDFAVRIERYCR